MKIILVAGARPNFMKIAPIMRELNHLQPILVHTGQHYDYNMSESFFELLGIKKPDYNLRIDPGSYARQVAEIMTSFEAVCLKEKPGLIIVVGDVNSTLATALVAKILHIKLAHIEAGLRSYDRLMPEETNRVITDSVADILFATEPQATRNLIREGLSNIHYVGNVMIDNLFYQLKRLNEKSKIKSRLPKKYICMTMHRPENVDNKNTLRTVVETLNKVAEIMPIVFPCHPRTKKQIDLYGFKDLFNKKIIITEPLNYNEFLSLWKNAALVITDSGGLQEETTALKIPCITIRKNTERPITVEIGSNVVVGTNRNKIIDYSKKAFNGEWKKSLIPELWDGQASKRIVDILLSKG